jgi:hypothetical protein
MKKLKDVCIDFFKNEDTKKDVRDMVNPIFTMIYNEIYVYVWIIAIYNIFFIFIVLAIFFIILNIYRQSNIKYNITI